MKAFILGAITALFLFVAGANAQTVEFNLCTGSASGNYFAAGNYVAKHASNSGVAVKVQESRGSNENLDRLLAGSCQGAFVQSDALNVYASRNPRIIPTVERSGVLYQEALHLVCNRKTDLSKITGLTKDHVVAIGPDGAGNRITWEGLVLADKKRYGAVRVDNRAGLRALNSVTDGSEVQCMLYVAALNASFMKQDVNSQGSTVYLVSADDSDLLNVRDGKGKNVYSKFTIPGGTYRNIQKGTFSSAVDTVAVDALFVVNTDWLNNNERAYDRVLRAFNSAKPDIAQLIAPKN